MADSTGRKRRIFLSAVSRELRSFREAVAPALEDKGYEVVSQERFPADYREVKRMLLDRISPCDVVLCLVGFAYGGEPEHRPEGAARRSYTQLEYDIGTELNKPLFVYFAKEECGFDPHDHEADEVRELQAAYRRELEQRRPREEASTQIYQQFASREELVRLVADKFPGPSDIPPPRIRHNLPFASLGTLFKGREKFLAQVRQALMGRPAGATLVVAQQVLHGLGGVGKTRLAIEYAWRYMRENYTGAVLFATANTPSDLRRNLAALAGPSILNLPEQAVADEGAQAAAVVRWLQGNPGWLLILDNVDTEAAAKEVEALLPHLDNGHLLITSRLKQWNGVQRLELDVLEEAAAAQFLLERTKDERRHQADDAAAATELARELGRLALALEAAGAYIAHRGDSLREYLTRWRQRDARLREWFDERQMKYARSLATTWQTTEAELNAPARALLRILAWLATDPISEDLLRTAEAGQILADAAACVSGERGDGPADALGALADLAAYSLVKRPGDGLCTMHRVVQDITRGNTPREERREWIDRALRLVTAYAPGEGWDVRTWPVWDPLRPHAEEIVVSADEAGISQPTSRLMNELGLFLKAKCVFDDAESLYRRALAIGEQSFGPDHLDVAIHLNNLAQLLHDTNRLSEAEPLVRRALAISERFDGPDQPNVAIALTNLAQLLQDTNRLSEAEALMRQALAIGERSKGPDHANIAVRLNNLAQLLQATNRLSEAEPLMRRALAIDEQSYGPEHPKVAIRLNNLAQLLQATNRLSEAEPLMRRALAIDEQSYGPDHPNVAIRLNNLAHLLRATNRLSEAEPLMRRCVVIRRKSGKATGYAHPDMQDAIDNYRRLLEAIGHTPAEIAAKLRELLGGDGEE